MIALLIGLLLFFAIHMVRIVAPAWRTQQIARFGEQKWKGLYSLVSIAGFALLVWGYGQSRAAPELWAVPRGMAHLAALLTLIAFVLVTAAYVPRNHFKVKLGHPMLLGTKLWAFAHLLSNARLGDMLLFGSFLVWAIIAFAASRRRDRLAATQYPAGTIQGSVITLVVGMAAWAGFALFAHAWLIGVRPLG